MGAVEQAFRILRMLHHERWMTARDVAKATKTPIVSTYRRLGELEALGAVERSPRRLSVGKEHLRLAEGWRRTIVFIGERIKGGG